MARPAVDGTPTQDSDDTGSSSHSFAHTSNADFLLVFIIWTDLTGSSPTVTNCDYNSVDMTFIDRSQLLYSGDNYVTVEAWYEDGPPSGSNTVDVTISEACEGSAVVAVNITGGSVVGSTVWKATGNGTSCYATATSEDSNSLLIMGCSQIDDAGPYTEGTGVTEVLEGDVGAGARPDYFVCTMNATGGSDTIGEDATSSQSWAVLGVELREVVSGDLSVTISNVAAYQYTGVRVVG